jgi:hypothetical protein
VVYGARIERRSTQCTCTDTTARVHMELRPRGQSVFNDSTYIHADTPARFPSASVLKADQWPTRSLCLSCRTSSTLTSFSLDFGIALCAAYTLFAFAAVSGTLCSSRWVSSRYAKDLPSAGRSVQDVKILGVGSVVDLGW